MKRSTDRILTSHAGSLHGPEALREMHAHRAPSDPLSGEQAAQVKQAIDDVVRLQKENGVDVANDGEYTKGILIGWMTYARADSTASSSEALPEGDTSGNGSITAREIALLPAITSSTAFGWLRQCRHIGGFGRTAVFCTGPLKYIGQAELQARHRLHEGGDAQARRRGAAS